MTTTGILTLLIVLLIAAAILYGAYLIYMRFVNPVITTLFGATVASIILAILALVVIIVLLGLLFPQLGTLKL